MIKAERAKITYTRKKAHQVHNNGQITPLKEFRIARDTQTYYHDLLMRFEKK